MAKGPSMSQLGDGGPSFTKSLSAPNFSIGQIVSMPIKLVTNPLEGLRSLGSLVSGGNNPLDKVLKVTGQFTSILKGNPKILLDEAMGGADGKGGGLTGGIAAQAGDALAKVTEKGIAMGGEVAGKGVGMAGEALAKITGKAVAAIPIPIVAQAVGIGIASAGPVINQAAQVAGKVGGKVLGQIVKQAIKTSVKMAVSMAKTVMKKGIQLAKEHGPCKLVGQRTIQGKKPSIINPATITKALTSQMRLATWKLNGQSLKKGGQRTMQLGKSVGGFAGRTVGSMFRAGQAAANLTVKASEASKAIGTGRPEQAVSHIRDIGSAAKGGLSNVVAPGREAASATWGRRTLVKKPFTRAIGKVSSTPPMKAAITAVQRSAPVKAFGTLTQGAKALKTTISTPFKWPGAKVQALKETSVGKTVSSGFRMAAKPVHWTRTAAGTTAHLARIPADLAKASNQLASASKALGQGNSSAAIDQAHSASSHVASAPSHAQSAASRLTAPSQNPPKNPSLNPNQANPNGDPHGPSNP